jgi:hypothetical protein
MNNVAPAGKRGTTEPKQTNTLLLIIIIGFLCYKFKHTYSTIPLRFSYDPVYLVHQRKST